MKKIIHILLICVSVVAKAQQPGTLNNSPSPSNTQASTAPRGFRIHFEKPDDFVYHVWAGMAINAATGSIIYAKTKNITFACLGGFLSAVAAGILKEAVWDGMMKKGVCNNTDAYATFWGGAVGFICLRVGIDVHERKQIDREYFENLPPNARIVDTVVVSPGDTTFLVEPKPIKYN